MVRLPMPRRIRVTGACWELIFWDFFIVYAFGMIYYYVISNFYLNSPIGVGALFLYCFVLAVPGDIVLCIVAAIIGKRMIPLIQGGRLG